MPVYPMYTLTRFWVLTLQMLVRISFLCFLQIFAIFCGKKITILAYSQTLSSCVPIPVCHGFEQTIRALKGLTAFSLLCDGVWCWFCCVWIKMFVGTEMAIRVL